MGNNDNYWDWENNMETGSLSWEPNVEYIMTAKGLERTDKSKDDNDNGDNEGDDNSNNTIEEFRKSKEQMEKKKSKN